MLPISYSFFIFSSLFSVIKVFDLTLLEKAVSRYRRFFFLLKAAENSEKYFCWSPSGPALNKYSIAIFTGILQKMEHCCNGLSIKNVRKIFRKINISNPLIRTRTCAYQGVRNVSFSGNFAYVLNGWPLRGTFYSSILKIFPYF